MPSRALGRSRLTRTVPALLLLVVDAHRAAADLPASLPWIDPDPLWPVPTAVNSRYPKGLVGFSAGNHRAEVEVDVAMASLPAIVAHVEWRRRAAPPADTTAVVAVFGPNSTLFDEFAVVNATAHAASIAFAPRYGSGRYDFYYLPYNFAGSDGSYRSTFATPSVTCDTTTASTSFRRNNGTAAKSIVHSSSGDSWSGNAAWKVADGVLTFLSKPSAAACEQPPLCQGWNAAGGSVEWIVFDMGTCVTISGFALYAAGDHAHDPRTMWIEVGNSSSALVAGTGVRVGNFTGQNATTARQEFSFPPHTGRFWRWASNCRWSKIPCPGYQTYLAELEFEMSDPVSEGGPGGAWRHVHNLDGPNAAAAAAMLPTATDVNLTARTEWDAFTEMEVMASPGEIAALFTKVDRNTVPAFPTPRELTVRDFDSIPLRWAAAGPSNSFSAEVELSEYFTWQIGLINPLAPFAAEREGATSVPPLNVSGYTLALPPDAPVSAANLTCFNLGGIGYDGVPFTQSMSVARVGSLWFGIQIPDALSAPISLQLTLHFDGGMSSVTVDVNLTLKPGATDPLPAHGDRDPTRLARLRWLNSEKGLDFEPSAQYSAISGLSPNFSIKNRSFVLGNSGHFSSIESNGMELLTAPIQMLITDADGDAPVELKPIGTPVVTQLGPGAVQWSITSVGAGSLAGVSSRTVGALYYDGFVDYNISLMSSQPRQLHDVRLVVPMDEEVVKWIMGWNVMPSGRFQSPINFSWTEYGQGQRNGAWIGKPSAGMRVTFKGPEAAWNSPIEMPSHPPATWANCPNPGSPLNCHGTASVTTGPTGTVVLQSQTGPLNISKAAMPFHFDLLVTPLRPVDLHQHFTTRYFHFGGTFPPPGLNLTMSEAVDQIAELGSTWVNIHQGSNLNPYINYPLRPDLMGDLEGFVALCHARNLSVKLYFTTRELTNRCSELFALKSLPNHEVLFAGPGGGGAWLGEHLVSDYAVRWSQIAYNKEPNGFYGLDSTLPGVRADEAIGDTGYSRFNNFYTEAVHFTLLESPRYLDGIAFDRSTVERVRKGMEAAKSSVRIDIHQSNGGGCKTGGWGSPALKYMQHFAFADSLWFGEGFDYWGQSADWWLLEASGLPFGLTGDMIREGPVGANGTRNPSACPDPNRWLGMVFGMTARGTTGLGASSASPEALEVYPLWKYMREQHVQDSTMHGWWEDQPLVRVAGVAAESAVVVNDVKATAFMQPDDPGSNASIGLIAVGNFGNASATVTLSVSMSTGGQPHMIGEMAHTVTLVADQIEAFQAAQTFAPGAAITIPGKRGYLLRLVV